MRTLQILRAAALAGSLAAAIVQPARSQTPAKPDAAKPDAAKADAADAAAAMERAQRLANNPLRMILEASRVRRKGDAEPAPEPADAPAPRRAAAPAPANTANAAETPTAPPPQPALVTLAADATLAQPLATDAPALKADAAPQAMLSLNMSPGPLPSPEMAALLVQPKLVAMTPPDIPQRVIDQVGRVGQVTAELTIRPDGTVADVAVLPPAPRALHRSIIDALLQWRYEPLPGERKHRVELVFGRDG